MGFVLLIVALGVLMLGPKRVVEILGRIARAKAQLEHVTRQLTDQLDAEPETHDVREQVTPFSKPAGER